MTYQDQHTLTWRARAVLDGVRVWVGPYPTEHKALVKAMAMARDARACGEAGDFIVHPETGVVRRRDVHEPVNAAQEGVSR